MMFFRKLRPERYALAMVRLDADHRRAADDTFRCMLLARLAFIAFVMAMPVALIVYGLGGRRGAFWSLSVMLILGAAAALTAFAPDWPSRLLMRRK